MNAEAPRIVVRRGGAQDVRFLRDMLHHAYYWKERAPDAGPGPVALYVKAWGRPGDTAVIAIDDGFRRAYPILAVDEADGRVRVFTKRHGRGFEARPAKRWELPVTAELEIP